MTLLDAGEWAAMPGVKLTENSESRWVKALGYLSVIVLFPIFALGFILLLVPGGMWEIWKEL